MLSKYHSTITQSFYDDDSQFNDRITKLLLQHANALSKIDVEQSISKDVNYQKHLHKIACFVPLYKSLLNVVHCFGILIAKYKADAVFTLIR